jgi:ATP-dependent helicase/nuclease subunit A
VTQSEAPVGELPDEQARGRVVEALDANLLVEAGAGSGKTTALVKRMVALVRTGTTSVEHVAAVTFTRKAAAELRQRFQMQLEKAIREVDPSGGGDPSERERLTRALEEIDRAFIGTIHAFCARLLREHPLEVGLDPAFEEVRVEERHRLRRDFWNAYLERLARDSDPLLEELAAAKLPPTSLYTLFDVLVRYPDVAFPAPESSLPGPEELAHIRKELESLVDEGWELMGARPIHPSGWDRLQEQLRELHFERDVSGWGSTADLFDAIAALCKWGKTPHKITKNRWRDASFAEALLDRVNAFGFGASEARDALERWLAHRYALAVRLAAGAAGEFEAYRRRLGKLDFEDLLVLTGRLLREQPRVRRALGERYRHLLVDEFQDTDPLQAEIMMLLASDPAEDPSLADGPATEGDTEGDASVPSADWRGVVPRVGALFVVGDPKQSIYRFRRADIQLYDFVRRRFQEFGEVLSLSANFRSRPAIGAFANAVFAGEGFFPAEASREQAAFERLDTQPPTEPVVCEGVFAYDVTPDGHAWARVVADDAARLSGWIRARIDSGERSPRDFMILTWRREQLAWYARALEGHDIPVQVTGSGVEVEEELLELQTLIECMIDPSNQVKVVAALVGLFFGLDYDHLVRHRTEHGRFDAMRPTADGDPDVVRALQQLNRWWRASTDQPSDVFVAELVEELGLLPFAASGPLGTLRAGALLYVLDVVRATAAGGDSSLPGALRALQAGLELSEAEAPFEPDLPDAVQLMNLHQAKGLEANVVILADPSTHKTSASSLHVERTAAGDSVGFARVGGGRHGHIELARPLDWAERQQREEEFRRAEQVRLLYVAVTRAREELVVSRWPGRKPEGRLWAALDPGLEESATMLETTPEQPEPRPEADIEPSSISLLVDRAAQDRAAAAAPSYRRETVTSLAKGEDEEVSTEPVYEAASSEVYRGLSWGSAVHGALAVAAREPGAEALRAACRDLLVEFGRPLDDHGEPRELDDLRALVDSVRASQLWQRAQEAERLLTEVPFSLPDADAGRVEASVPEAGSRRSTKTRRQLDLFAAEAHAEEEDASGGDDASELAEQALVSEAPVLLEGVIDLAFREEGGWVIADYKTDVGTDPRFAERVRGYRRQVDLYADAWTRLTREPVKERIIFYTTQGHLERW